MMIDVQHGLATLAFRLPFHAPMHIGGLGFSCLKEHVSAGIQGKTRVAKKMVVLN